MALSDLYKSIVIDHNRDPRNYRALDAPTHDARGLNALCGDDIRVYLEVIDNCVANATFTGEASAITMASASLMTCRVRGLSIAEVDACFGDVETLLTSQAVSEELRERLGDLSALEGVREYPSRIKSATLPWHTLRAALRGDDIASTE